MKMIRVEFLVEDVEVWLREHLFHPDTLVRLVLEPGLDWQPIVDEIEVHPAAWEAIWRNATNICRRLPGKLLRIRECWLRKNGLENRFES